MASTAPPIVDDLRRSATEAELLAFVRDAAAWGGWMVYHTHRSDRSEAGFPDIVAVHRTLRRLVFAELKTAKGKVTVAQDLWLEVLGAVTDRYSWGRKVPEVYLWRPCDAREILDVFLGHRGWRYHPGRDTQAVASGATPERPRRP